MKKKPWIPGKGCICDVVEILFLLTETNVLEREIALRSIENSDSITLKSQ